MCVLSSLVLVLFSLLYLSPLLSPSSAVSNEQPRSKLSSYSGEDLEPAAPAEAVGRLGGDWPGSGGEGLSGRGGLGLGLGHYQLAITSTTSTSTSVASTSVARGDQYDCSVQFMWQPTTNITYPFVTLLASFQVS